MEMECGFSDVRTEFLIKPSFVTNSCFRIIVICAPCSCHKSSLTGQWQPTGERSATQIDVAFEMEEITLYGGILQSSGNFSLVRMQPAYRTSLLHCLKSWRLAYPHFSFGNSSVGIVTRAKVKGTNWVWQMTQPVEGAYKKTNQPHITYVTVRP
jgi:hypothetical protein